MRKVTNYLNHPDIKDGNIQFASSEVSAFKTNDLIIF